MATKLIGLYSPTPQSGKSTVAGYLATSHGFYRRGFATALKQMVGSLLHSAGLDEDEIAYYAEPGKEEPIPGIGRSFRHLTQTIGTEWGRKLVDSELWVNLVIKSAHRPNLLVIEDVRFPNEFYAIREAGGEVWRIERPSSVLKTSHQSEGLLEDFPFDAYLTNDGSLSKLWSDAGRALAAPWA